MSNEKVLELELYGEVCCDICNDIARNYIDCPCCGKKYARTEYAGDMVEETGITCGECESNFETVDGSFLSYWRTNKVYKTN